MQSQPSAPGIETSAYAGGQHALLEKGTRHRMSHIVYQLRIALSGSEPPIWRSIQVLGSTALSDLHDIVQAVMGWKNEHFYQFIINDRCYGDAELGAGESRIDASAVTLGHVVKRPKTEFIYEYDFSDGWEHEILVEKIRPLGDGDPEDYPTCLAGENACPPEDCGGIFGYYELLSVLKDASHPAHAELKKQYGSFDPATFDPEKANDMLQTMFFDDGQPDPSEESAF